MLREGTLAPSKAQILHSIEPRVVESALELTILMPCLDEAETIGACVAQARGFLERAGISGEVLVADNGSTDGSVDIAERGGARVIHVAQRGYGSSVLEGIGSEWISVAVQRSDGSKADVRFDRGDSLDIAAHFGDKHAALQRYVVDVDCNDDCILQVKTPEGDEARKEFQELQQEAPFGFAVGKGTFFVDTVTPVADTAYQRTAADALAERIRTAIFSIYKYLFVPVLVLGALGFVISSVIHWRHALRNTCYVLALVSWVLVLSRFGLLLLVAATSLPGLLIHYMAPAYLMLVRRSVFMCCMATTLSAVGSGVSSKKPVGRPFALSRPRVSRWHW